MVMEPWERIDPLIWSVVEGDDLGTGDDVFARAEDKLYALLFARDAVENVADLDSGVAFKLAELVGKTVFWTNASLEALADYELGDRAKASWNSHHIKSAWRDGVTPLVMKLLKRPEGQWCEDCRRYVGTDAERYCVKCRNPTQEPWRDTRRKLLPGTKIEIVNGSELLSPDGEIVRVLIEGQQVVAESLLGPIHGKAQLKDSQWSVEDDCNVALINWEDKRACFISYATISKTALAEATEETNDT